MVDPPDWQELLDVAEDAAVPQAKAPTPWYDTADPELRLTREERKRLRDEARREWRGG
jgi:hypothetical protein